jgi:dihydrofolate reductase
MFRLKKQQQHKTRYIALAAVTADGRISLDTSAMPDWTSPEDWKFFQSKLSTVDVVVAGSTTYEAAKKHISKRVAYVLTSTVSEPRTEGSVTFVNPDVTDLAALLGKYARVGIVGGADAYRTMFDLGLCDELYLTIEPVACGRGRELLTETREPVRLRLISTKKLNRAGTIVLHYEVLH